MPEPSGLNSRMSARFFSPGVVSGSSTLEAEPTETNIFLPSAENCDVAGPVAAASGAGRRDVCGGAARLQVAVVIGEAHDGVGVADVDPLRIRAGRIKRDAEGAIESGGEDFCLLGLAVGGDAAEDA